jgi:hypothetical protein
MINVSWTHLKNFANERNVSIQKIETDDLYYLWAFDGPMCVSAQIKKEDPANEDQTDFETNYIANSNKPPKSNVVTASEVNDKTLRTFCVFNETDANGQAEFIVLVPQSKRYVAYGDIEFEQRHFGDYVSKIEVVDIDRLIAWQTALAINPAATEPVADEIVQANGFPFYPVIGHYDEKATASMQNDNTVGTLKGGMAMTFAYGLTEAQPIGGYGELPGGFYFRVCAQKAQGHGAGYKCQLSIDWAEPNE